MKIKWVCLLMLIGMAGMLQLADAADTYEVDAAHSMIIFRAKHMGVSNNYGRFNQFSGMLTVDEADAANSAIELEVKAESVDTGNEKRDQHLRSPDFFNAKQFPVITFKSTKVEKVDEDTLKVTGNFELHGVKKSVTVEVEMTGKGKNQQGTALIGFETIFTIKRSEFGMNYGIGAVSDEVRITVSVEGMKK